MKMEGQRTNETQYVGQLLNAPDKLQRHRSWGFSILLNPRRVQIHIFLFLQDFKILFKFASWVLEPQLVRRSADTELLL